MSYREKLWNHTPLTDFWRIGSGYARRLEKMQIFTMGDLARFSEHGEDLLFRMFGVAAELLIDHAWGYEPCTMQAIKSYKPKGHSISQGQVLPLKHHTPMSLESRAAQFAPFAALVGYDEEIEKLPDRPTA